MEDSAKLFYPLSSILYPLSSIFSPQLSAPLHPFTSDPQFLHFAFCILHSRNRSTPAMRTCPSCGAPLDDEGICTSCGALARGFFHGLDLGAPHIADAVARGLDFYRLLGVASDQETR